MYLIINSVELNWDAGGAAVNYVAVTEALGVSSSVVAAGLAADNLICAVYFTTLFTLASSIPAESDAHTNAGAHSLHHATRGL